MRAFLLCFGKKMSRNTKKEEISKTRSNTVVGDEDIISSISDDILCQILSFLPIKEAVRTSVLSTRWYHVWKLITNIHLDDTLLCPHNITETWSIPSSRALIFDPRGLIFETIVSRFLFLPYGIQRFSLFISDDINFCSSQVDIWIYHISQMNVQELNIRYTAESFCSNCPILSCNSLVKLILEMDCTLKVPNYICLPNLQHLTLHGIAFVLDPYTTDSKDLMFCFPVLKVLHARKFACLRMNNVRIQAPQLEGFFMASPSSCFWSERCVVQICTTRLKKFYAHVDQLHLLSLSDSSSLFSCEAVIFTSEDIVYNKQEHGPRFRMLLEQFQGVPSLKLCSNKIKVRIYAREYFVNLPFFGRLVYLLLKEVTIETLLNFLHKSPLLKTLVFTTDTFVSDKGPLTSKRVPYCLRHSLRIVKIKEFKGYGDEIRLAKYFLDNSAILEQLIIYTDSLTAEELQSYPNISSFVARVKFVII